MTLNVEPFVVQTLLCLDIYTCLYLINIIYCCFTTKCAYVDAAIFLVRT